MALTIVQPILAEPALSGPAAVAYDITAAAVIQTTALNTVTGITQATNAVVTVSTVSTNNPFYVGEQVVLSSVAGMTQINQLPATVTAIGGTSGAWTVALNVNSSAFSAYTSGGAIQQLNTVTAGTLICQVGGAITLNDCNTVASAAITNQIFAGSSLTAGQVITLNWPCMLGLTASVVTTGTFSLSFTP